MILFADTASVYHTSNGWQTYDVQLTVPGGSLVAIDVRLLFTADNSRLKTKS